MLPFGNQTSFRGGLSGGHSLKNCHASQGLTTGTERVLPTPGRQVFGKIIRGAVNDIPYPQPSPFSRALSVILPVCQLFSAVEDPFLGFLGKY
jgi:hypothetical protein